MMRKITLLMSALAISALCVVSALATPQADDAAIVRNLDVFNNLYKELNTYYVDSLAPEHAIETALQAMLGELDPYTEYIPAKEAEDFMVVSTGQYGGIGSYIIERKDSLHRGVYISSPSEGSPAARAGLRAGDKFIMIDGDSTAGWSSENVSKRLKGQPHTSVHLVMQRPYAADSILTFDIMRETIDMNPVPYYGVTHGDIGYIVLTTFNEHSAARVREALVALKKDPRVKHIVLDLRGNGGGVVEGAVQIVGCFVPKGSLVLVTRGRAKSSERIYKTTDAPVDTRIPLAVLIDGGSASASEITAGALQDMDRAVIIGARSFGKGLVQSTRPLPYDGLLKVTTAKYYLPSGRPIQEIDYSQRDNEGTLVKTRADSVARTYRTTSGRVMPEGKGITPDLEVMPAAATQVLYALVRDQSIFDFATQWAATHPTCPDPDHFQVTDELFDEFKQFVKDGHYKADETNQEALKLFRENVKKEGYLTDSVSAQFDRLAEMLRHDTDRDMDLNRAEISRLLSSEIMDRYYYQRGQYQNGAITDECLARASEMFAKPGEYKRLLKP